MPKSDRKNIASSATDLVLEVFDSGENKNSELDSSVIILGEQHSHNDLFMVDTVPKMQDDLDIPMYGKVWNNDFRYKK